MVLTQAYQLRGNLYLAFVNVSDSFNCFSFLLINSLTLTNNAQHAIIVHVVSFELVLFVWFTKCFGLLKSGVPKVAYFVGPFGRFGTCTLTILYWRLDTATTILGRFEVNVARFNFSTNSFLRTIIWLYYTANLSCWLYILVIICFRQNSGNFYLKFILQNHKFN